MPYSDSKWLTLRAGLRNLFVQEHCQVYDILQYSNEQKPQMITLIGQHVKNIVIQKIDFGIPSRRDMEGEIHLRADKNSLTCESPLLFSDCELHNSSKILQAGSEGIAGGIVRKPLIWPTPMSQDIDPILMAHMLYAKLIAPFSTVICFFAEDLGGLSAVAKCITLWLLKINNRPSDLPQSTNPRVIILTYNTNPEFSEQDATEEFIIELKRELEHQLNATTNQLHKNFKRTELDQLLSTQFGGIYVINTPPFNATSRQWRSLRRRILRDSTEIYRQRVLAQAAFSAYHFQHFFHLAIAHFCIDIVSPFSFISASRISNPISLELLPHLTSFLSLIDSTQIFNFAVPVIASALMLNGYPQKIHHFRPSSVFKHFFYDICFQASPFTRSKIRIESGLSGSSADLSTQFVNAIENLFCQYMLQDIKQNIDKFIFHRNVIINFCKIWKGIYSNTTCLLCLTKSPENTFECGHALCSPCTITHGQSEKSEPWTFIIAKCPFCNISNIIKFYQKPNTAGVRAIIAEGGGVRGVIPLTFLKELEKSIGLPMDIRDHFDIAFGSSSGALIILGLFFNKWNIEECLIHFQILSSLAFKKSMWHNSYFSPFKIVCNVLNILISFITDSRYSSSGINLALKTAFGETSPFFQSSNNGAKVAIVASRVKDSSTCIFANYNGPGKRAQDCGYELVRPRDIKQELPIWQAARASTAAPTYFKSFQGYHDGGLGGHNNPINLALWEQDTIWNRKKKQPDTVLSLGTGFKRHVNDDIESREKLSFLKAHCIPRLFRSFMNFFVGESRWQELQNTLLPQFKDRYHRMNIVFHGDEPDLDDVQAIPNLQQQATYQATSSNDIRRCADNLLAALFYIELDTLPIFDQSFFICKGKIRCRLEPSHRALLALADRLKSNLARFHLDSEQTIPCITSDSYRNLESGGRFCQPIVFTVVSLDDYIDIKIDGSTENTWSISNCPYKIATLITDQGLDNLNQGSRKRRNYSEDRHSKRVKYMI